MKTLKFSYIFFKKKFIFKRVSTEKAFVNFFFFYVGKINKRATLPEVSQKADMPTIANEI